jgi:16S rRNA (cytosine967-C5)-methyltransferase
MSRAEGTNARRIASKVLARVHEDRAFASAALDAELRRTGGLDPRDAALATELVYGVLRTQGWLDARIAERSSKARALASARARAELHVGAYSLAFLDRIPGFAAVSEAVEGVRAEAGEGAARYANAVLRGLAERFESAPRPSLAEAIVASAPGWLRGSLRRSLGRGPAADYLAAGPVPPPLGIAVAPGEDRASLADDLRRACPDAVIELGLASPSAITLRGAGDPRRLPGFEERFIVQEEGAQVVAHALGPRAGEAVLDACAGRGNKSWLLGAAVGPSGRVALADKYPAKLSAFAARAWSARHSTHAVDWTVGVGDVPDGFDRVLVDAPCSGVGTLRRRPEIAIFRGPDDVAALAAMQVDITRAAATRARDGGTLLYAVCSVLREEAEEVVDRLVSEPAAPGLSLEPVSLDAPALDLVALVGPSGTPGASAPSSLRLLPSVHGTDGYFMAAFRVRRV